MISRQSPSAIGSSPLVATSPLGLLQRFLLFAVQFDERVQNAASDSDNDAQHVHHIEPHVEQQDTQDNCQTLLDIRANSHGQRTSDLVRGEAADIERKGEEAIAQHDAHKA